jgi:hypothetical protein
MHAYLTEDVQDFIIEGVRGYNGSAEAEAA